MRRLHRAVEEHGKLFFEMLKCVLLLHASCDSSKSHGAAIWLVEQRALVKKRWSPKNKVGGVYYSVTRNSLQFDDSRHELRRRSGCAAASSKCASGHETELVLFCCRARNST